jgi:beta-carotene ketolase (CrtW type)
MKSAAAYRWKGVVIALLVIVGWLGNLVILLRADIPSTAPEFLLPAILLQTFLTTGLFITAHDAMHGTVAPHAPQLNNTIGSIAVVLYALFDYRKLRKKHWEHHKFPASDSDPDFHDGAHPAPVRWYLHFMREYLSWQQLLGMALVFNILHHLAGVPLVSLLLLWVLPALLSTVQLFYFGTYLPHREPAGGYSDPHRAESNAYPIWLSFISCYHFGYHYEHHEYPSVPWWQLPSVRREVLRNQHTIR